MRGSGEGANCAPKIRTIQTLGLLRPDAPCASHQICKAGATNIIETEKAQPDVTWPHCIEVTITLQGAEVPAVDKIVLPT